MTIPHHWIAIASDIDAGRAKLAEVQAIARKEPEFARWLTDRTQQKINEMISACDEIPYYGPDRGGEGEAI